MTGRKVGEYQIAREIAYGSMGTIYQGRHATEQYDVIVKEVSFAHFPLSIKVQLKARFRREAFIQNQIKHAGIAKFYGAITTSDALYLVTEYISGVSLKDLIRRDGVPTPNQAVYLFKQALEALEYAHNFEYLTESDIAHRGLIHRDLKPSNLFVDLNGKLKITDFGIVRMPERESMAPPSFRPGTVEYMPPEQMRGLDLDERSDIFSLGVTFYEVLTGVLPFVDSSGKSTSPDLFTEPLAVPISKIRSEVPPQLSDLIMAALHRNPGVRYQSVSEFLSAIKNYERNKGTVTEETEPFIFSTRNSNTNSSQTSALAASASASATTSDTGNLRLVYSNEQNNSMIGEFDVVNDAEIELILASYRDSDIQDDSEIEIIEPESDEFVTIAETYTQPLDDVIAESTVIPLVAETKPIQEILLSLPLPQDEKLTVPEVISEYLHPTTGRSAAVITLIVAALLFVIVMAGAYLVHFSEEINSSRLTPINKNDETVRNNIGASEDESHPSVMDSNLNPTPEVTANNNNDDDPIVTSGNTETFRRAVQLEGVGTFNRAKSSYEEYINSNASIADINTAKSQIEKIDKFVAFVEAAREAVNKKEYDKAKTNFEQALKLRPYSNAVKKELEKLADLLQQ